jgi:hypothetical protein
MICQGARRLSSAAATFECEHGIDKIVGTPEDLIGSYLGAEGSDPFVSRTETVTYGCVQQRER